MKSNSENLLALIWLSLVLLELNYPHHHDHGFFELNYNFFTIPCGWQVPQRLV